MKKYLILLFAVFLCFCGCTTNEIYLPDTYTPGGQIRAEIPELEDGVSVVITDEDNTCILVGCGDTDDFPRLFNRLKELGITQIEALILLSDTEAYTGGYKKLMANFPVKEVYLGEGFENIDMYYTVAKLNSPEDCSVFKVSQGTRIYDRECLYIDVVFSGMCYRENNKKISAMTLYLTYGEKAMILEGAVDVSAEKELVVSTGELLKADVLVVPHCGSEYIPGDDLIDSISPIYAVIPVYGDTSPGLGLQRRLEQKGITVLRTDTDGTITLVMEEKSIKHYKKR